MKNFLNKVAILFVVLCLGACSEAGEGFSPESMDVTPNNISGYWKLTEYNGMELPEGVFCYVEYIRKDKKFVIYQKFDSMYPRRITGIFSIDKDKYGRAILSGVYDYSMGEGEWNNKYYVTELSENSLVLTADSENADVSKYERCVEIPADVIEAAK